MGHKISIQIIFLIQIFSTNVGSEKGISSVEMSVKLVGNFAKNLNFEKLLLL